MATDMVLDFYESINFELIDIDGYDTLFTELLEGVVIIVYIKYDWRF